jgi:hypothetical protein
MCDWVQLLQKGEDAELTKVLRMIELVLAAIPLSSPGVFILPSRALEVIHRAESYGRMRPSDSVRYECDGDDHGLVRLYHFPSICMSACAISLTTVA